ncbi:PREDICTED: transcription elongation factor B polypeptide 2 [Bison bison bison]|uniref:Transcription elongation factor B polypeptide 2 n=1 Tax=Bison bison bison TaxID=43346 RepID=A0A6P3H9I2_BISBB|nr:PREDICTED: transcription elongation factor B polypeptide 2 [Bison bison bison]
MDLRPGIRLTASTRGPRLCHNQDGSTAQSPSRARSPPDSDLLHHSANRPRPRHGAKMAARHSVGAPPWFRALGGCRRPWAHGGNVVDVNIGDRPPRAGTPQRGAVARTRGDPAFLSPQDDQLLDDGKTLGECGFTSQTARPQAPATVGLAFRADEAFEALRIEPFSSPPELPDVMKPQDSGSSANEQAVQ